jgi:hypothetical protein
MEEMLMDIPSRLLYWFLQEVIVLRLTTLVGILVFAASAQDKPEKFVVFLSGVDDAVPVVQSLTKLMNESKPFEVAVSKNDPCKLLIMVSCIDRKQQSDPFVCMYISQYNGAAFKTFLGSGLLATKSADEAATGFLGSIAKDILEGYNTTDKENLRQGLEACVFLTDSKCNVPIPLQKELDTKQITLSQYLLARHEQGKE